LEKDITHRLDLRGLTAPVTLLMVMQAFRRLKGGETLEILGSDVETRKDLLRVLQASRYELISFRDDGTFYHVLLRKGH
jgi:TusA-related sulfurtransferase